MSSSYLYPSSGVIDNSAPRGNPALPPNLDQCPGCGGQGMIVQPDGTLYQLCPMCSGTGIFLGVGSFYTYGLDLSLVANGTQLGTILIQQNRDFRWLFAVAQRTGTFTFTLDINGNQFQTVFGQQGAQIASGLSDANFWGPNASNPFPLPIPILVPAYNRLNINVTDTSGAPNTINFSIIGAAFEIPGGSAVASNRG